MYIMSLYIYIYIYIIIIIIIIRNIMYILIQVTIQVL
jgi:hypothetical protein